jgi:hypothetical protein
MNIYLPAAGGSSSTFFGPVSMLSERSEAGKIDRNQGPFNYMLSGLVIYSPTLEEAWASSSNRFFFIRFFLFFSFSLMSANPECSASAAGGESATLTDEGGGGFFRR